MVRREGQVQSLSLPLSRVTQVSLMKKLDQLVLPAAEAIKTLVMKA
jgi:hypothetical protein